MSVNYAGLKKPAEYGDGLGTVMGRALTPQEVHENFLWSGGQIAAARETVPIGIPMRPTVLIRNNATDAANDIDFLAGSAWDHRVGRTLTLPSMMTKRLDAAWATGHNSGGLFVGAKAPNTWYYCFAIRRTSDGHIDCGFDPTISAANIPAGYAAYKRVGAVRTDGAGNIVGFNAKATMVRYALPLVMAVRNPPLTTGEVISVACPPNMVAIVNCVAFSANLTAWVVVLHGDRTSPPPDSSITSLVGGGTINSAELSVPVNASSQIYYRWTNGGGTQTLWISIAGFIDPLED